MTYYKIIKGQHYDAELLQKGEELASGLGDCHITMEDAKRIYQLAMDGKSITEVERSTIHYLLDTLQWKEDAKAWMQVQLGITEKDPPKQDTGAVYRSFFESELRKHWQRLYDNYLNHVDEQVEFWSDYQVDRNQILPAKVKESVIYYLENVENADFGIVRLYFIPKKRFIDLSLDIKNEEGLFVVRVTTDGDDGWVELFEDDEDAMGFGRTYIELVSWGEQQTIRDFVQSGGFPQDLEERKGDTLWGK